MQNCTPSFATFNLSHYRSDRKQLLAVTMSAGRLVLRHANKSAAPGRGDRTITPCCKMAGTSGGGATRSSLDGIITGAMVMLALLSHGFCASLDEAKAKFAETWRAWLTLNHR